MTKDEVLKSMSSISPHERLQAARYLARNSDKSDLAAIREARAVETDTYVRSALEGVIAQLETVNGEPENQSLEEFTQDVVIKAKSQAIEWATGLFLHEVASPFGLVANAASREVPDYENSSTKRHVERVQRIFKGIEQLRAATATPKPEEFDLAQLIDGVVAEESTNARVPPTPYGQRPFLVNIDPNLLRFALRNGLCNALEAMQRVESQEPVVITWGITDVDYWIAIIDQGPGITGPIEAAFEVGRSTKRGHSGFGLAIARQAMTTLGGVVTLNPATNGGARYEVKWSR